MKVAGELLLPEAEIRKLITLKPGDVFSRARVTESTKAISDRLGNDGYAFANVNAAPELDKEKRQAAFTFFIDPGRRVYVRRINIAGNSRSRDEVIRREMRQIEGGVVLVGDRSRCRAARVDRLGYFTEVNVETPAVQGTTDQVDVNVSGGREADRRGAARRGLRQRRRRDPVGLGRAAEHLRLGQARLGRHSTRARSTRPTRCRYTDPYYTVDGVSRGFDLYLREIDADEQRPRQLPDEDAGRRHALRRPDHRARHDQLRPRLRAHEDRRPSPTARSSTSTTSSTFGAEERRDTRHRRLDARQPRQPDLSDQGHAADSANVEVALPGASLNYYKADTISTSATSRSRAITR